MRPPRPPAPPPPPRGALRRSARWLVPLLVLALAPLPIVAAAALAGGALWVAARMLGQRRARAAANLGADPDRIQLGSDARGRPVSLDERQLSAHGLILGASGSGKSTTLLKITAQQIMRGQPVVAIDLKGSAEFAAELAGAARAAGRPLRVWTLDGDAHWNPLAHGNATELKDKLIGTERFSEPHYKRAAERYVQTALQVLAETDPGHPASLSTVVEMLEPRRLSGAARRLSPDRAARVQDYITNLGPDQLSAVRGLQSRLAVVSESHTGAFLEPREDAIDLRAGLAGDDVVLFSLNSSTYGQLAAQIGALVVQDLVSATGARERDAAATGHGAPAATVVIDEFSALGGDQVLGLIARGRSAGISVLLATQELADLDRVSRGFRQQVIGSTAVKIAHRQDVTESARAVAQLAGSEQVWEQSYSTAEPGVSGRGAARRVNSRLVDRLTVEPSTVQSLGTGEAVVITKVPRAETRLTRIRPLGLGAVPGPPSVARNRSR